MTDIYGRKPILLWSSIMTPITVAFMVFWADNLTKIYILIAILSLTYSSRGSTAIFFGNEFMPNDKGIYLVSFTFIFDGILSALTAWIFRFTKS
jgi:hypothetical protein